GARNFMTELPRIGSTEVWEIANLTEDAHPIHLHLVQFQLINRQDLAKDADDELVYRATYDQAFPGRTYIPQFGPPNSYSNLNHDGAVGGNPAFSPFLSGRATLPDASDAGWKDT